MHNTQGFLICELIAESLWFKESLRYSYLLGFTRSLRYARRSRGRLTPRVHHQVQSHWRRHRMMIEVNLR
jgi:hypothetical protein